MAAAVQQPSVTPDVVGNAFVHQYYLILHQSPELVHRFYQDVSKLGRPEDGGVMSTTTTMHAINEKILSLGYEEFRAEITAVDSQESYNGGVLVLVTGYLIGNDNLRQKFTQSFFLAPQDKGYFVLNDVFRYVDDAKYQSENLDLVNNVEVPVTPDQDPPAHQNYVREQSTPPSEEANGEEVCDPSENGDGSIVEEAPVPEADEIPGDLQIVVDSQIVVESKAKIEEMPSIVKVMRENAAPFSRPALSPLRAAPKSQEQVTAAVIPQPTSEVPVSTSKATENGNIHESEAEGPSIYVKGLPLDATLSLLEDEFKRFGPIRAGGVQVRSQKGFCFGFVEFEVASAAQSAIEASPIIINGCRVGVEEKRSTSRGNNRGRFSSGPGTGYRNERGFQASPKMINGRRVGVEEKRSTSRGNNRGRFSSGSGTGYRNERGFQASPKMINGCWVGVEEKRSTSRGNNRGRFSSGAGAGYRNERGRGCGNFGGGKSFGRGDFSNRTEFGNRNGNRCRFSNHAGDGFRRADTMGQNGGNANCAGGLALNAAAETTAPRISSSEERVSQEQFELSLLGVTNGREADEGSNGHSDSATAVHLLPMEGGFAALATNCLSQARLLYKLVVKIAGTVLNGCGDFVFKKDSTDLLRRISHLMHFLEEIREALATKYLPQAISLLKYVAEIVKTVTNCCGDFAFKKDCRDLQQRISYLIRFFGEIRDCTAVYSSSSGNWCSYLVAALKVVEHLATGFKSIKSVVEIKA